MLAIGDLTDVIHIAGVLRRNPPGRQVVLLSDGQTYDDPSFPRMPKPGLAVTYARISPPSTATRRFRPRGSQPSTTSYTRSSWRDATGTTLTSTGLRRTRTGAKLATPAT